MQLFSEGAVAFQEKIVERSGMADDSYLSDGNQLQQWQCYCQLDQVESCAGLVLVG